MRRRALAFDLVQACNYHVMSSFHAEVFDHLHMVPPPRYLAVTLTQILGADRAAWPHMAETLSTLKRDQQGNLPLDIEIAKVLAHPSVTFHLLPLPLRAATDKPIQPKAAATPKHTRSRTHPKGNPSAPAKGKGKGKGGKSKRGRGRNIPRGLIGKCLHTKANERLCWAFNLPQGCQDAKPGSKCARGLHLCAGERADLPSDPPDIRSNAAPSQQDRSLDQYFCIEIFAGSGKPSRQFWCRFKAA